MRRGVADLPFYLTCRASGFWPGRLFPAVPTHVLSGLLSANLGCACGVAVRSRRREKEIRLASILASFIFLGEEGRSSSTSLLVQTKAASKRCYAFRRSLLKTHSAQVATQCKSVHTQSLLAAHCFLLGDALRWRGFKALFLPCPHFTAPAHNTQKQMKTRTK